MSSHYKYLIIEAEMMDAAPVGTLHKPDLRGSIGLVAADLAHSNDHNCASEALWKGKAIENLLSKTENLDVAFHLGQVIRSIDLKDKCVTDDVGQVYTFEKLLLASRGAPRQLPFGADRIIYFRSLQDYQRLRMLAETGNRFAVIGGGFIGAEVAAALAMSGKEVVIIFPDKVLGARMFPIDLSLFLNEYFRKKGVEIQAQESVIGLKADGELLMLETKNKPAIIVNNTMAGVSSRPNAKLAKMAGLQMVNGSITDELLYTSHLAANTTVYHSGAEKDRCVKYGANLKGREKLAPQNTCTESTPYQHLPFFQSDIPTFLNWDIKQSVGWIHSLTLLQIGKSHLMQA